MFSYWRAIHELPSDPFMDFPVEIAQEKVTYIHQIFTVTPSGKIAEPKIQNICQVGFCNRRINPRTVLEMYSLLSTVIVGEHQMEYIKNMPLLHLYLSGIFDFSFLGL